MTLKASIQKQKEGELTVIYLYIPREGHAPMLLLEFMEQENFVFRTVQEKTKVADDRFFKIHINATNYFINRLRTYINDNL